MARARKGSLRPLQETLTKYTNVLREQVVTPVTSELDQLEEQQIKEFLTTAKPENIAEKTSQLVYAIKEISSVRTQMQHRLSSIENRVNKA